MYQETYVNSAGLGVHGGRLCSDLHQTRGLLDVLNLDFLHEIITRV